MHPTRRTWRVRGIPRELDSSRLTGVLRHHPDLRWLGKETYSEVRDNGASIQTIALDLG